VLRELIEQINAQKIAGKDWSFSAHL
jgi:hypothetical protein